MIIVFWILFVIYDLLFNAFTYQFLWNLKMFLAKMAGCACPTWLQRMTQNLFLVLQRVSINQPLMSLSKLEQYTHCKIILSPPLNTIVKEQNLVRRAGTACRIYSK